MKGIMMFETIQMTLAVPNTLLSVPLFAFIIAKICFLSRGGSQVLGVALKTMRVLPPNKVLGVQHGEPGLSVGAVEGRRH